MRPSSPSAARLARAGAILSTVWPLLLALLWLPVRAPAAPLPAENTGRAWLFWTDDLEREALSAPPVRLTERAERRLVRSGTLGSDDRARRPIPSAVLDRLDRAGIRRGYGSRLLRAVVVEGTAAELRSLEQAPWVRELVPCRTYVRDAVRDPIDFVPAPPAASGPARGEAARRGDDAPLASWDQLEPLGAAELLELGIAGRGVRVALLDSGFFRGHTSVSAASVIAAHDFVGEDEEVAYTPGDPDDALGSDSHGTAVWSALGGKDAAGLLGPAWGADFLLARTEQTRGETRLEEEDFVAGLEWADSLGADVISSSLGYREFEDGFVYPFAELDGRTAVTSRIAGLLARRGIVFVTAVGNDGPTARSLLTPADADSILAVGSVGRSGRVSVFSSRGPAADGRVKPDLAALGEATLCANRSGGLAYVSGTSLATPLVAGLAVQLRELHPEWTAMQVIEALRASGDSAEHPDSLRGFGIPDGFAAGAPDAPRLVLARWHWQDAWTPSDTLAAPGDTGLVFVSIANHGSRRSEAGFLGLRSVSTEARVESGQAPLPPLEPGSAITLGPLGLSFTNRAGPSVASGVFVSIETDGSASPSYRRLRLALGSASSARFTLSLVPSRPLSRGESLQLELDLPAAGRVRGRLVDPSGREVAVGFDFEARAGRIVSPPFTPPGRMASGAYFLDVDAPGGHVSRRVLLIR